MIAKRLLILADTHIRDDDSTNPILHVIEKFIPRFNPDILVYLGDTQDCEALQGFNHKSPSLIQWSSIHAEISNVNKMLNRHESLCNPQEKHYWLGNHEERLNKFKAIYSPMAKLVPDLTKELKLKERRFSVHKQNDLVNFGKLYAMHGNAYGINHVKKNLLDYEVSLVYGHVHSPQMYTKVASSTRSPKSAWSIGCASGRNPEWLHGKPNAWVPGFAVAYILPNGNFNLYPINIIHGSFLGPDGRVYN